MEGLLAIFKQQALVSHCGDVFEVIRATAVTLAASTHVAVLYDMI